MYYSKGTCEGLCTAVRVHVRVCVLEHRVALAQNPIAYLHCTPPHTLPSCTPSTHTPSLHSTHPHTLSHCSIFPTHTLTHCSTHPPTRLHYRYKGQKTPLNFVHLNLSVVLFLALCLFVGGGWYLRKFKVRMYLCVRVCVCVCMRVCVCVHECVQKSCCIAHS